MVASIRRSTSSAGAITSWPMPSPAARRYGRRCWRTWLSDPGWRCRRRAANEYVRAPARKGRLLGLVMPRFAANLGYLFTDRPLLERIDAAASCGFKAIELQFPYDVPASAVKAAIDRQQAHHARRQYAARRARRRIRAGGRARPRAGLARVFASALDYIAAIGGSAVHCLAGKVDARAAPGGGARLRRQSQARRRSCRGAKASRC